MVLDRILTRAMTLVLILTLLAMPIMVLQGAL
jgi:hypothetical protein